MSQLKDRIEEVSGLGYCFDCSQGSGGVASDGFALYFLDGRPSHWFCRYCGSNNVMIRDTDGRTIFQQGDIALAIGA